MSNILYVENDTLPAMKTGTFLLDFYADFCGPCKMISPYLDEISKERGDVTIVKINVEKNIDLTKEFNVRGIPSLFVLKEGEVKANKVGGSTKNDIIKLIDNA